MNKTNIFSLQDKNAWITGASYGIGFSIAKAFVAAGAKTIIFNSRNEETLQRGLQNYNEAGIENVKGYICDVTNETAVKELIERIHTEVGQIDILVNNAGIIKRIPMHEMNYPYQALEESLVNAYYHRRYDEYQPVEVNIMPDMIEIISYGGAERSIKLDDLRAGKRVHARRYRNPRLGEFLKELHLTEGRGTGFPTIHEELRKNGSPDSIIEADDDHTYFIIRIPCHPEFVCDELRMDEKGHILPVGEVWKPDDTDVTENVTENVTDKVTENVTENVTGKSTAEKRRDEMLRLMKLDKKITTDNLANILHVSRRTVARDIDLLRSQYKLRRDGGDYDGSWIVIES